MKSVLISIQPKWCALISNGKKTFEVRKTKPKLKPPFRCYIYCTKGNPNDTQQVLEVHGEDGKIRKANGKVIGEFVCDEVIEFTPDPFGNHEYFISDDEMEASCLNAEDLWCYAKGKTLYGWHISSLVIYDKPKELCKFRCECKEYDKDSPKCGCCEYYYYESNESIGFYEECSCDGLKHITRPPQSWCYAEEQEV